MTGNPPQLDKLQGLALEYARIPNWLNRMLGRVHPSKRRRLAAWARAGLAAHGRMVYTEGPQRGELLHRKPGSFVGAHADCSQYASACAHWSRSRKVNATDWTGSLWDKCRPLAKPTVGGCVIFGAHPGVHMGVFTGRHNGHWVVTGFGTQTGPDANTLGVLEGYFQRNGHPGVYFLDLTR